MAFEKHSSPAEMYNIMLLLTLTVHCLGVEGLMGKLCCSAALQTVTHLIVTMAACSLCQ